ncbi:MAG: VRR-NUC domain-containing protein [bacterium]|nr:VRR-NUC domain-containing protein [bacterium]MDO5397751.1 VRR-NUC domain-containing protein [bacterium]
MSRQYEAAEQSTLIDWSLRCRGKYPELGLLFHIPNGGSRNRAEAVHLKRQGVKAGVPDLFLPTARGKYHGLFIEMKYGKNKPTNAQREWMAALNEQGYLAVVCYGFDDARDTIERYLGICT